MTRYAVRWQDAHGVDGYTYVLITEGYSTVGDIPKILSIRFPTFDRVVGCVEV